MKKNADTGVVKTFTDYIYEMADSKNAARTAIKAVNSYFGHLDPEVDPVEFGKLTLKKLANITGIGPKSFDLLIKAYRAYCGKK